MKECKLRIGVYWQGVLKQAVVKQGLRVLGRAARRLVNSYLPTMWKDGIVASFEVEWKLNLVAHGDAREEK